MFFSAIGASNHPIPPIGFLFLKLPPPPRAVLLVIYLELWPILVFLAVYGRRRQNQMVVIFIFIENNAVRDALIKGASPLCDIFYMLALWSFHVSSNSQCAWYTKVASDRNPADDPSQGNRRKMAELINAENGNPLVAARELVNAILSVDSFIDFMQRSVQCVVGVCHRARAQQC